MQSAHTGAEKPRSKRQRTSCDIPDDKVDSRVDEVPRPNAHADESRSGQTGLIEQRGEGIGNQEAPARHDRNGHSSGVGDRPHLEHGASRDLAATFGEVPRERDSVRDVDREEDSNVMRHKGGEQQQMQKQQDEEDGLDVQEKRCIEEVAGKIVGDVEEDVAEKVAEEDRERRDEPRHGLDNAVVPDGGPASLANPAALGDRSKITRARSAWMIFLSDHREKVRMENPGIAIGPMQKILSEMWKGLNQDETARYNKLAEEDKDRMKRELAAAGLSKLPAKQSASVETEADATSLILPLARVRKTVRLDPAVGNISKEGLLLVTKAVEVFMAMMADKAWTVGKQTGRKSVKPCDVADYVFAAPEMYWLRDEFRTERSSAKKHSGGSLQARVGKKATPVAKGAGAITSFFQKDP